MFNISKSRNEYSHSFIYSSLLVILMFFLFISFIPDNSFALKRWVPFTFSKGGSKDSEPGALPEITILDSNENHTLINVLIPGMWVDDVVGPDSLTYQVLEIPDYTSSNSVGFPALPEISGLIGIPDNTSVDVNVINLTEQTLLDKYYIWPHQKSISRDEEWIFEKNEEFYNSNIWYPLDNREIGDPGIFKYYTIDNVGYIPFKYNPYLRQLKVNPQFQLDVIYSGGSGLPTPTMDEDMANLFDFTLWNFEELPKDINNTAPVYYLIITPEKYYGRSCAFANWIENNYGYIANTVTTNETGNTAYDIKEYIKTYYDTHIDTKYVLLIGDFNEIPTFRIKIDPNYEVYIDSDYFYTLLKSTEPNKSDFYPEFSIGRIPIYSEEQLDFELKKIASYYDNLYNYNPNWIGNVLLVAHKQHGSMEPYNRWWFKAIDEKIANYNNYGNNRPNFIKCYGEDMADNECVNNAINNGVSTVLYDGHGNEYSWVHWNQRIPEIYSSYTAFDINALNNINMLPVVFNCCCWNSYLYYLQSLSESWNELDYFNERYIGAVSNVGYTYLNYGFEGYEVCNDFWIQDYFAYAIYRCIYERDATKEGLGWLMNMSTIFELKKTHIDPGAATNAYGRLLCGDPALIIKTVNENTKNKNSNKKDINKVSIPISIFIENPASYNLNITINSVEDEYINIDLYDISGRKISNLYKGNINSNNKITYDVSNLSTGLYVIRFYNDKYNLYRKVVIE